MENMSDYSRKVGEFLRRKILVQNPMPKKSKAPRYTRLLPGPSSIESYLQKWYRETSATLMPPASIRSITTPAALIKA